MQVHISCCECQLIELLEELFHSFAFLFEKYELILGIGFLISVLEGGFTSCVKVREGSSHWECIFHALIDEIGCKPFQ